MPRIFSLIPSVLVCLAALVSTPAHALMIAPAPIPERVAQAEVIVVGTVGKVESQNVSAIPFFGGKDKVEFQVVAVKIDDAVLGAKGLKEIRVGFVPPQNKPAGPIRLPRPSVILETGQEVCLFLRKHPEESFYVAPMYFDVMDKKNPNFSQDVELVKRCVKLLAEPDAGLKAKDADDRLLTAAMLLSRYRTDRSGTGKGKTEPVEAEQSKLILQALADADWSKPNHPLLGAQMSPQQLFLRLGLTDKDGWSQPKDFKEFPALAKNWLKENAGTYRLQRFAVEKPESKE